jgi:predicted transport protein
MILSDLIKELQKHEPKLGTKDVRITGCYGSDTYVIQIKESVGEYTKEPELLIQTDLMTG